MRVTVETLRMRIFRLKQRVAESPPHANVPEEIRHILETAPRMLQDLEEALRWNDPEVLKQVHEALNDAEGFVEWAVATAKGTATAEAIQTGQAPDPSLPAHQRLMHRITRFLTTKLDGPTYLSLVQEFAGEDSVVGNTVHMDPRGETEAFSQWLLHDTRVPGESQRLIDVFADEASNALPPDEQALLQARLVDRPSIYQVVALPMDPKTKTRKEIYRVRDLLSPTDVIRIQDRSTSRTLEPGAIFIGRAIPIDTKDRRYSLLGTITELPEKLWSILSGFMGQWSKEYFEKNPDATTQDFFRAHHARLRRKILELTG